MVLAQDTEYVFLDEPLNNLDMSHSVQMMRQLRAAADELGRTVIVVMHEINFASRYSDNILAMNDGQVTHFDTCADTMKSSVLTEIFGTCAYYRRRRWTTCRLLLIARDVMASVTLLCLRDDHHGSARMR